MKIEHLILIYHPEIMQICFSLMTKITHSGYIILGHFCVVYNFFLIMFEGGVRGIRLESVNIVGQCDSVQDLLKLCWQNMSWF